MSLFPHLFPCKLLYPNMSGACQTCPLLLTPSPGAQEHTDPLVFLRGVAPAATALDIHAALG